MNRESIGDCRQCSASIMDDVRQKIDAKEILKEGRETREGKETETDGEGDEER